MTLALEAAGEAARLRMLSTCLRERPSPNYMNDVGKTLLARLSLHRRTCAASIKGEGQAPLRSSAFSASRIFIS